MSETDESNRTGENIVQCFSELRRFCRNVSLLLETAGELMKEDGWCVAQPTVVFSASRALNAPEEWLPYEFCRFFKKQDRSNQLLYIAVNVGDPYEEYNTPVKCALLSAGSIAFKPGSERAETEHWWSRWHLFMKKRRRDDGSICTDEPAKDWKRE